MPQHQNTMHINRSLSLLLLTDIHSKVVIINHNPTNLTSLRWCMAWSWLWWKMSSVVVHSYIQSNLRSLSVIFVPYNVFAPKYHAQILVVHGTKLSRWKLCSVVYLATKLHYAIPSHDGDPTHWLLKTLSWTYVIVVATLQRCFLHHHIISFTITYCSSNTNWPYSAAWVLCTVSFSTSL
jgi:hypothetical protein